MKFKESSPESLPKTLWGLRDTEQELIHLLIAAVRAGLQGHPEVQPWLETQRALGNYDLLRQARSKVETGVQRPWSEKELEMIDLIQARALEGKTKKAVQRELEKKGLIGKMDQPNFSRTMRNKLRFLLPLFHKCHRQLLKENQLRIERRAGKT